MKNLLITNNNLYKVVSEIKKSNNCEILVIKKNLKTALENNSKQFNKIILITEKILSRNSEVYKIISNYIKNKKSSFIEVGFKKSQVPLGKAMSKALINGSGRNTILILEKIIGSWNV